MPKTITIIGGGLAGLTLGAGLRQRGVPVTLWETGRYPRHRVCGEFISGRGQQVLARLGLLRRFEQSGAVSARNVVFQANQNSSPVRELAEPALCLSRYEMDALLAEEFQRLGGELHVNSRWSGQNFDSEGVVRATGRRLQATEDGWRWFGLKVHARGIELKADLEMHALPYGYLGLGVTSGAEVNVCGLFRRRAPGDELMEVGMETLRGPMGSPLRERLDQAQFDENSFCAVAGIALRPRRAVQSAECCIGDAVTMIPPVTGNGMSMAFESAELAIEPLADYSDGKIGWAEAQRLISSRCDNAFTQRLAWARWLQWMMFSVAPRPWLGALTLRSDLLWQMMFAKTR